MEKNFQYTAGDFIVHETLGLIEVVDKRVYLKDEMLVVRKVVSNEDMTWVVEPDTVRPATDIDIVNLLTDCVGLYLLPKGKYELPGIGKLCVTKNGDLLLQTWVTDQRFALSIDEVLSLRDMISKELL